MFVLHSSSSRLPLLRHQLRASAAESSVCGHGNAVGLTSVLHRGLFFIVSAETGRPGPDICPIAQPTLQCQSRDRN